MSEEDPLKVIQAARLFRDGIIELVGHLPRRACSGLRGQFVEAAGAISALLSEGFGRGTRAEKLRYCRMANGSLEESQEYLRECVNAQLIDRKTFYKHWNLSVAISRMLLSLIECLERHSDG